MTCTNQQVIRLKQMSHLYNKEVSAAKSGMSLKTARKYAKSNQLPSEMKKIRHWKTRSNIFDPIWPEIEDMLVKSPKLQAVTILEYLQFKDTNKYNDTHLRTLQRLIRNWNSTGGSDQPVIFNQKLIPGRQSQSDYTVMNELGITIDGEKFDHLLFHFMLPYSRWEHVSLCYSESLQSLTKGYDEAVWALGFVAPEHRTDNLTAATQAMGSSRVFTKNWQEVMDHYCVVPSRNNPGISNENGSVEKSHDLLKKAISQQLMLRGSSNFSDKDNYMKFINQLVDLRNLKHATRFAEEISLLKTLPSKKYYAPQMMEVKVSSFSTIRLLKGIYSVPSRLIGYKLRAYIYHGEIRLYYGSTLVQEMPQIQDNSGACINYRHLIKSLLRKPGAFANYYYRDYLFPSVIFRTAHDMLVKAYPTNGAKQYLQILQLAAIGKESDVQLALELLIEAKSIPSLLEVASLLKASIAPKIIEVKIKTSSLRDYDSLLKMAG
jgi:hypothetical protein